MAWSEGANEIRVLIAADLPASGNHVGQFLSLRHPKSGADETLKRLKLFDSITGDMACYLYTDMTLQEIHWFKQSHGSWFLGEYICEDGRLYTATPVDPVFMLLPIFDAARLKKEGDLGKFRQLDEIMYVDSYPGYHNLLTVAESAMQVVCDVKEIGTTKFFRLNDSKVLNWLCYKVHRVKQTLPALDKNYAAQAEKDTLVDAVSIVGEYLKEEPWLKLLCNKLKLDLQEATKALDNTVLPPSTENGPAQFNPEQEKNGNEKKTPKAGRQAKKAKVETDSRNIRDMFTRACRKGK